MNADQKEPQKPIEKLLSILKSWKGLIIKKKPETPDFDQFGPSWNQTEADYQKEQQKWLEKIKKEKEKEKEKP